MHRTRIEPEQISIMDDDYKRSSLVAFRVYCSCGFVSPVPLLNQPAAADVARAHREIYDGEARTAHDTWK